MTPPLQRPVHHPGGRPADGTSTDGDDVTTTAGWHAPAGLAERLREEYLAAHPWPHVVVQDLFPADLLAEVAAELESVDRSRMTTSQTSRHGKRETSDRALLGPASRTLQDLLDGPEVLELVQQVTGVPGLRPDPEHYAAGVHETPVGGRTMVHTDFAVHPVSGLHHRVNVLVYLNPVWEPAWGGQLELWPADMSALGRRIEPTAGTVVVFETHGQTLHGLPEAVACPPGTSRLSMAAYYYSTEPAAPSRRRLGTYVPRPGDPRTVGLPLPRDLFRRYVPAAVQRRVWALLRPSGRGRP